MNTDMAWESFLNTQITDDPSPAINVVGKNVTDDYVERVDKEQIIPETPPEVSDLYISTKTKIAYLNTKMPLDEVFWAIKVMPSYSCMNTGVVKKEMKFKSTTKEALQIILDNYEKIPAGPFREQQIKMHMNDETGSTRFRDIRKISVGLSKKQITSFRTKTKGAFFNCFAVILRILWNDEMREVHIKIFNTGKLEIPGIPGKRSDEFLTTVLDSLIKELHYIKEIIPEKGEDFELAYDKDRTETVLTNSNFSCNYLVDREKLSNLLKNTYKILCTYDPCSYPGIQSRFHYVEGRSEQNGNPITAKELEANPNITSIIVPCMIFRTGSVLIVGKFKDDVLYVVYDFIKTLLTREYAYLCVGMPEVEEKQEKKTKKRFIIQDNIHYKPIDLKTIVAEKDAEFSLKL